MFKHIKRHHRFMSRSTIELLKSFGQPVLLFLTFLSATLMMLSGVVVFLLGPDHFLRVNNFLDALYYVVTTMTGVGYGDLVPLSPFAKIVSMALMLLGTAIYACFAGTLAGIVMSFEFDRYRAADDDSK